MVAQCTKIQDIKKGPKNQDIQDGLDLDKIQDIQEGHSFSPELGSRLYQNSGHTGRSFFYTRIWLQTLPKFKTNRRVFLFHQNLVADLIKIQDIQDGLSFSPEFGYNWVKSFLKVACNFAKEIKIVTNTSNNVAKET